MLGGVREARQGLRGVTGINTLTLGTNHFVRARQEGTLAAGHGACYQGRVVRQTRARRGTPV